MAKKKVQSNWIKVEEQMPEVHQAVIFTNGIDVYVGEYCGGSLWMDHKRRMLLSTTTHWQPLPEAPKGE